MQRLFVVVALATLGFTTVACSDDGAAPAATSVAPATTSRPPARTTAAPSDTAADDTVDDTTDDTTDDTSDDTSDDTTDDTTDDTLDPVGDTTAGGPIGGDPKLADLATLTSDQVCEAYPKDEIQRIVGQRLAANSGTAVAGLGVNCIYDLAGEASLGAKFEFGALPWNAITGLTSLTPQPGAPAPQPCTIAGKTAVCAERTTGAVSNPASVYVKLGGEEDIALYVASDLGLDVAKQLADYGATHLPTP